jgi:hypothetical protein
MVTSAGLSGDGVFVATLVGTSLAAAVIIAVIVQLAKREPFTLAEFIGRVFRLFIVLALVFMVLAFGLLAYMFRYG